MTLDEIKALPVAGLAHEDAILWLWTTIAHQESVYGIARAWGFEHKSTLTWDKVHMGLGDWLLCQTEHCLLCARGKPVHRLTNQRTMLRVAAGRHSAKPEEFYNRVDATCPGSKLEIFARRTRPGWTCWGNELGKPPLEV
jgi:N6-adenosine-specific RNA methylase IME4